MLKLQYFGHLMRKTDSLWKTLMLGKIEGRRRRGWQRIRWLYGITNSMDMNLSKLREAVKNRSLVSCSPWDHKELDMTEQLKNNERTRKLVKLVQSLRRHLNNLVQACWKRFVKLNTKLFIVLQFSSVQSLCRVWFCNPMDCSTLGFSLFLHQLLELAQTHVHLSW